MIASKMSRRSCATHRHHVVPLRKIVACSPSRCGLLSIASASVALSFTFNVASHDFELFQHLRTMILVRLDSHRFTADHSDRPMQHFQILVRVFCCAYHANRSCFEFILQQFAKLLTWSSVAALTKSSPSVQRWVACTQLKAVAMEMFSPQFVSLLAPCVPYIVLLSLPTNPGRCKGGSTYASRLHTESKCALDTSNTPRTRFGPRRPTRSAITWLINAFKHPTGGTAGNTSLGSSFSSSVLAFLIPLTTSRALTPFLMFCGTHFSE